MRFRKHYGRSRLFRPVGCGFVLVLIIVAATLTSVSAPGDLDPSFGQSGRVFTSVTVPDWSYFYPNTESILVQPDGRILVCGRFWEDGVSYWYGTYIIRYMPDGSLDSSFGTNGKVALIGPGYPNGGQTVGADMALQPDGKIVLIGQYTIAGGILVQRYTASGQLDTTFGNSGTTLVTGNAFEEGSSITVQADGKIVGVGWEYNPYVQPYYDAVLLFRLNINGSIDPSFGPAGTGVVTITDGYDRPKALIQADGKVLVVGTILNFSSVPAHVLIARYSSDGLLDSDFGTGGTVRYQVNGLSSSSSGAALQPDGKIVVIGTTSLPATEARSFLLRFNTNGALDQSFASNGVLSIAADLFYEPNTVLIEADGKIIATGNSLNGTTHHTQFSIARFSPTGSVDPNFGDGGNSAFELNGGGLNYAYASDSAIQPDGKILVTGYFGYYYTDSHEKVALIRVEGATSPVTAEASISGWVSTSDGRGISRARLTLVDNEGNVRYALTNPFGYYRFTTVATGQSYTIRILSKRQTFAQPTRVIFVGNDLTNIDFVASP